MSFFSNSIEDAFGDDDRPEALGDLAGTSTDETGGTGSDDPGSVTRTAYMLATQLGQTSAAHSRVMGTAASDVSVATETTHFLVPDFSDLGEGALAPGGSGWLDVGEPGVDGSNDTLDWLDPPDHPWRPSDDDILPVESTKQSRSVSKHKPPKAAAVAKPAPLTDQPVAKPKKKFSWNMEIKLGRKAN